MTDTTAFAGSIPEIYDRHLGPVIFAGMAAEMARRVAAHRPGRVLETAAGTGIATRALRDALAPDAELVATDLQESMLAVARRKFRAGERVVFAPADATALPYPDARFDAVVCQFGAMFFPDKAAGIREMGRVLAPGGRAALSVWDGHANNPFGRLSHEVVTAFFPVDPPQFQRIPFATPFETIEAACVAAGLVDITCAVVRVDGPLPDAAHFARGIVYGSPLIDQIHARGGVDPEAVVAALTAAFHTAFGPDPARMPLQALIVEAIKPA